jgi:hypothetical protein
MPNRERQKDLEKELKRTPKYPGRHPEKNFSHKESPGFRPGPKTRRKRTQKTPETLH